MGKILKPKVLGDVTPPKFFKEKFWRVNRVSGGRRDNFSFLPRRLNLSYERIFRFPATKITKFFVAISAAIFLVLGSANAPTTPTRASGQSNNDERNALEAQLRSLENQIGQYEDQIIGYQKQGKNLKGEITSLNGKIAKLNLQIQAINLTLKELNNKIIDTRDKIVITGKSIDDHRDALGRLLQDLYSGEQASLVEVFLKNPRISDFFDNLQGIVLLQNSLRVQVQQIKDLRNQLKDQQDQLSLARADTESARSFRESQKQEIDSAKQEKNKLLDITKGQESKYQALLKQTKETAAQIRSRIFQLLGGGELSFGEAYRYAKLASGATGVRAAFILAVLDRESALGQNVGRCSYKTAMSPSNQNLFLAITQSLRINPDVVTVSCPNRDGVYGGAMGPAQFVPSTWNLYSAEVSKVTNNTPASPWNNADAFVATALYIQDALDGCKKVYSSGLSQERCAAAKYYAGGRWRRYLWTYGEAVIGRARQFQDDINTITS